MLNLNNIARIVTATLMTLTVGVARASAIEVYTYSSSPFKGDNDYDLYVYNDCSFDIEAYAYDRETHEQEYEMVEEGEVVRLASYSHDNGHKYLSVHLFQTYSDNEGQIDVNFKTYQGYSITTDQDKIVYACDW